MPGMGELEGMALGIGGAALWFGEALGAHMCVLPAAGGAAGGAVIAAAAAAVGVGVVIAVSIAATSAGAAAGTFVASPALFSTHAALHAMSLLQLLGTPAAPGLTTGGPLRGGSICRCGWGFTIPPRGHKCGCWSLVHLTEAGLE